MGELELETEQPLPVPNSAPSVQGMVRADLEVRERIGRERYGTALQPHNGRDALRDAYEEALDLACYLRQAIAERDARPEADEAGDDEELHYGGDDAVPFCDPGAGLRRINGVITGGSMVFDWDAATCPACLAKRSSAPNVSSALRPSDGKRGCPVKTWDGLYEMRCDLGAEAGGSDRARGNCAYHGPFAQPVDGDSAPYSEKQGGGAR